jgi:predicted dehydrogenase
MGVFEASRFANGNKNANTVEVNGSKGSIKFDLERLDELEVLREGHRGFETVLVTDESDPYVDRWWPAGHIIGWEHTFVHENYEFLTAIDEGGEYHPDFADGLQVQEVLAAIEESDERGERVQL